MISVFHQWAAFQKQQAWVERENQGTKKEQYRCCYNYKLKEEKKEEVGKQLYSHSLQDENKVYTNLRASSFFLGMERQHEIVSELLREEAACLSKENYMVP